MKVFTGITFNKGKQVRCVVATTSAVKASKLTGESVGHIRKYWSVTGNKAQIEAAMSTPETPLYSSNITTHDYKPLI